MRDRPRTATALVLAGTHRSRWRPPIPWGATIATAIVGAATPITQAMIALAIGDLHQGTLISVAPGGMVDASRAWTCAGSVVGLVVVRGLLQMVATWRWAVANVRAGGSRMEVVRAVIASDAADSRSEDATSAFDRCSAGQAALQRLMSDVPALALGAVLVIAWCAPLLAVVASAIWMTAAWTCVEALRHYAVDAGAGCDCSRRWSAFLRDEALGARSVRGLRLESARAAALHDLLDEASEVRARHLRVHELAKAPLQILLVAGQALIALVAVGLVMHEGLDLAGLIATLVVTTSVAIRLEQVPAVLVQVAAGRVAAAGLMVQPAPVAERVARPPLPASLCLRLVPGAAQAAEPGIVAALTLRPGELVALVGRTGDGKEDAMASWSGTPSALGRPCRFGSDDLGWSDLASCPLDVRTRLVQSVGSDSVLLSGSVAGNVRLGRCDLGEAELLRALRLAGADEVVAALPQGLAQEIGEGGLRLSGGQRQRLCLARAIAACPRFLCLDEATNGLDPDSEARIAAGLRHLADDPEQRSGVLLATSSPVLLAACDRVLVIARGRVIDHGTDAGLRSRCPLYADLLGLQPAAGGGARPASSERCA